MVILHYFWYKMLAVLFDFEKAEKSKYFLRNLMEILIKSSDLEPRISKIFENWSIKTQ